jgi:hypothetical protein
MKFLVATIIRPDPIVPVLMTITRVCLSILACLALVATCRAETASSEQIAGWIVDLDAGRFADRQRASENLARAGKPAIAPLAETALGDSREASARAIQILKTHLESRDQDVQQEAHGALERIADSGPRSAAGAARRALNPQPGQAATKALRVSLGELRLQLRDNGADSRVQIDHRTGVKEIDAVLNGQRVRITHDPQHGITVEVVSPAASDVDRPPPRRFTASDLAELKSKAPAYAAIYEKLLGGEPKETAGPIAK